MKTTRFRQVLGLLRFNLGVLLQFEVAYKLLSLALLVPLSFGLFRLSLALTRYSYLTAENILSYAVHPATILLLFFLLLLLTFFSLIDISAVICILDASYQKKKLRLLTAADFAFQNAVRVFQPRNFLFSLFVLFAAPVASFGVIASLRGSLTLPKFLLSYLKDDRLLAALAAVLFLALVVFMLRRLYCFHYYTLEGCSFREATKASRRLHRGKWLQDLFFLVLLQVFCTVLFYALAAVFILIILLCVKLFHAWSVLYSIVLGVILFATSLLLIAYFCLSLPAAFACISVLFYRHKERIGEKVVSPEIPEPSRAISQRRNRAVCALAVCCIGVFSAFSYLVLNDRLSFDMEAVSLPAVSAHRGASVDFPENTMLAFEQAVAQNTDWIELDVQLTKDGIPVVLHDSSLRRTAGVNRNIWDVTYAELQTMEVGSFFSSEFSGQKIPTLNAVLDFAQREHVNLNIELKPTGHETNFVPIVVDEILAHNFQYNCVVTSQDYSILREIKEYHAEIHTVYVMSVAVGNITLLRDADGFSVQYPFVTKALVAKVHGAGKELFVWTVNSQDIMKQMIRLHVDNIITDNITLAKQTIYESESSDLLLEYVAFLTEIFAT